MNNSDPWAGAGDSAVSIPGPIVPKSLRGNRSRRRSYRPSRGLLPVRAHNVNKALGRRLDRATGAALSYAVCILVRMSTTADTPTQPEADQLVSAQPLSDQPHETQRPASSSVSAGGADTTADVSGSEATLRLPRTLSPSKVASFTNCPLAFRFETIDGIPQPPGAAASKGTLVHRALERLMLREPQERTIDAAQADLDTAYQELSDHSDFTGLDLDQAGRDKLFAEARQLVENYFKLEDPTTINPIGIEVLVGAGLGDGQPGTGPFLRGVIDRLEVTDGQLIVTDYKTGKPPREGFERSSLHGVHIYSWLCEAMFGRRPAKVQLLYLSTPEAIIATPTEQSTRGVSVRTRAVWNAIETACARNDFRPKSGVLCSWCFYKPHCPQFGGDPATASDLIALLPAGVAERAIHPSLKNPARLSPSAEDPQGLRA